MPFDNLTTYPLQVDKWGSYFLSELESTRPSCSSFSMTPNGIFICVIGLGKKVKYDFDCKIILSNSKGKFDCKYLPPKSSSNFKLHSNRVDEVYQRRKKQITVCWEVFKENFATFAGLKLLIRGFRICFWWNPRFKSIRSTI